MSLSCVSQGGNPPATLTWYRADTELTSSTEVQDSVARSVVTFQVDHTDNGRTYTCRSTNSAITAAQTTSVTLNVFCEYFLPKDMSVSSRLFIMHAGQHKFAGVQDAWHTSTICGFRTAH